MAEGAARDAALRAVPAVPNADGGSHTKHLDALGFVFYCEAQ